jgi:hypothetical protein
MLLMLEVRVMMLESMDHDGTPQKESVTKPVSESKHL